jgi:FixJ family two-component response regulator
MSAQAKTVAVVDDDRSMLVGVERLLNAYGFATKVFASAEAFLDPAAAAGADCLVVDIDLGGMSGIELRRRLADRGCAVPIIFMTALDDEATRARALDAGCIAYLLKPFPSRCLIDAIKIAITAAKPVGRQE